MHGQGRPSALESGLVPDSHLSLAAKAVHGWIGQHGLLEGLVTDDMLEGHVTDDVLTRRASGAFLRTQSYLSLHRMGRY